MFINLKPLKNNRDYRFLFLAQIVSFLGSMVSYVAVPYQIYELTKSSFMVGLLGAFQLAPVLIFGLLGGSVADSMNRKKLIVISEIIMSICCVFFLINSYLPTPSIYLIYGLTLVLQAALAYHRPALEAITQKIVSNEDFPAVAALGSLRYGTGAIIGPALGGVLVATAGAKAAYIFDLFTFVFSLCMVLLIKDVPSPEKDKDSSPIKHIKEGLLFAYRKPELMGTYIIDIVAMAFAFPLSLFPAMGEAWGGAKSTGVLYSSMAVGSLIITLFSRWTEKVYRQGKAVIIAAIFWGVAILALGYANTLYTAVFCLILAGGFDNISGIFRGVIWNRSVPNEMRGRLAGIEMMSYMTGPLIGNMRAGYMAGFMGNANSIIIGGWLCVVFVVLTAFFLPKFWNYKSA